MYIKNIFDVGLSLAHWRDFISYVTNSINNFKKPNKRRMLLLTDFFTRTTVHVPDLPHFFKFKVHDRVQLDLPTLKRKDMGFKWSLYAGKIFSSFFPLINHQ